MTDAETLAQLKREPGRYDSHLPVLWAIGETMPIRTICEYGVGLGSTPVWLDRKRFPSMEHLLSYEEQESWFHKIKEELPPEMSADPRWDLKRIESGNLFFSAEYLAGTDLAFVDGFTWDGRIALLIALRGRVPLVVLHDGHGPDAFRAAQTVWPHVLVYRATDPGTSILSEAPLPAPLVAALRAQGYVNHPGDK